MDSEVSAPTMEQHRRDDKLRLLASRSNIHQLDDVDKLYVATVLVSGHDTDHDIKVEKDANFAKQILYELSIAGNIDAAELLVFFLSDNERLAIGSSILRAVTPKVDVHNIVQVAEVLLRDSYVKELSCLRAIYSACLYRSTKKDLPLDIYRREIELSRCISECYFGSAIDLLDDGNWCIYEADRLRSFKNSLIQLSCYDYSDASEFDIMNQGTLSYAAASYVQLIDSCDSPLESTLISCAFKELNATPLYQQCYTVFIDETQITVQTQVKLGCYRVDMLVNNKLVVELDGRTYHSDRFEEDRHRDQYILTEFGYHTVRLTGKQAFSNPVEILTKIAYWVNQQ